MGRWEKRIARENGIRNAMSLANQIHAEYGNVDYWTIHLHCPNAPIRLQAMIRSIFVNDGIVDLPDYDD
jgi:hypothetical protein